MATIIKARARYVKETGKFENNSFHNLKIKQDEWKVIIIDEDDKTENKTSKTIYDNLADFLTEWDICCATRIIQV